MAMAHKRINATRMAENGGVAAARQFLLEYPRMRIEAIAQGLMATGTAKTDFLEVNDIISNRVSRQIRQWRDRYNRGERLDDIHLPRDVHCHSIG